MAIVELQFKKQAFLDFFRAEINRRRLPFPTLDFFAYPQLKGKLLEQIECTGCTADATSGEGLVVIQTSLSIHYHPSLATIRAAGSLNRGATSTKALTIPITLSVAFVPQPNNQPPKAQLQASAPYGIFPPTVFPLSSADGVTIRSGAVEASETILAIRLGTDPNDPVNAPIVDRTGSMAWCQLLPGQLIADQLAQMLGSAVHPALSDDLALTRNPGGAWVSFGPSLGVVEPPCAIASCEVTAIDKCIFDIDISVDLGLVMTFVSSGTSLTTNVTLTWDVDSTLCDIVGALLLTPIGGAIIHDLANDEASRMILGQGISPSGLKKIGHTDSSITYQGKGVVTGPIPSCTATHVEITAEGMLVFGRMDIRRLPQSLQGEVTAPRSTLDVNCPKRSVSVVFRPAQLYLRDIGQDGPPRLFTPGVLFEPPDAWVAVQAQANNWLDLLINFVDPPGGRLPPGTATSAYVSTDCGVRWVDLGVIPHDHPAPTTADIAQMISHCMAKSDPWGMGIMNLDWLVDPPDLLYGIDPLRQWVVGARDLPRGTVLEFVAVGPQGEQRALGRLEGEINAVAELTTTAKETLQIRTGSALQAPAPDVFQRWVVPFASVALEGAPLAIAAAGNTVGIWHESGRTQMVEIVAGGLAHSRLGLEGAPERLGWNLSRQIERGRSPWRAGARLDRHTVAVVHGKELMIGRATAPVQM
jgi:hypothetical protein